MLPSSGLFTKSNCYLFEEKHCKRPHCVFRHDDTEGNTFDTSHESSLNLTDFEDSEEGLQKLERINRKIESVMHQVEEEQRKLSNCQMKKISSTINYYYHPEVIGDTSFSHTSLETHKQPMKYTVDCSKPRTDLEYDPLSNFSSDLRSYCSTSKAEHKNRKGHCSGRAQSKMNEEIFKMNFPKSQKLCVEHLAPNKEDLLITDYSPLPTKTEETKPASNCLHNDVVSNFAFMNKNDGCDELVRANHLNLTPSLCNSISNDFTSNNENVFVKMTQHLSNYNNLNTLQSCKIQNDGQFDKTSSTALPVNKSTNQIQKPDALDKAMASADVLGNQQTCEGSVCEPQDILSAAKWTHGAFLQSVVVNQKICPNDDVIVSESSSDELNYSDMNVSESDPDEECYRIFMEANGGQKSESEPVPEVVTKAETEKTDLQTHFFSGKKRVAHEGNIPEAISKARPLPQIIVPLCAPVSSTFSSRTPTSLVIRKVEQRASILTASVKAGQALISKTSEVKSAPTTEPAPCVGSISVGATVIDVGNNLHLVLPEGTFPVSDTSGSFSSVLTPLTSVATNPITLGQACHQSVATQPKRITQAVIIPPTARKPVSVASTTNPGSTAQASRAKPVGNKRKLKQKCETVKVPHDIRQSYVNKFTEEFLKTTTSVNEAFEKALTEERAVYSRSANKLKYLSIAVNALKRLRNQNSSALKGKHKTTLQTKGNIPLNPSLLNGEGVLLLYECLMDYVLGDEMLIESNFPFQNPEKPGSAIIFANKKTCSDSLRKLCCRCGATYSVSKTGTHTRKEECTYHYGRGVENKVPGGVETRYSCCEGVMGSPGCQVFKLHVCNSLCMDGYVATSARDPTDTNCPGVYSLDCEKCYTVNGLELSRVTVVNSDLQIVYDTFVRPNNEVIDYNTRFSGISEEDMKGHCHSIKEVQKNLLSFINADTILIGHGLETNLCVLKLLHGMVVDTSMVFPHRLGPPHKLSLHSLTAEYLRKIIQESACGHDTAEDAMACMELMLWKAKEDGRLKKAQ